MKRFVIFMIYLILSVSVYSQALKSIEHLSSSMVSDSRSSFAPFDVSIISLSVEPTGSGTVDGAGAYENGSAATLTATPREGYIFKNWTKDDTNQSYLSPYSFTVTETAEYVAHFVPIPTAGIIVGQPTTTEEALPSHSYYRYSLSEQIIMADELGVILPTEFSNVSFFNTGTAKTRDYTIYMVNTDKSYFRSEVDWIAPTEADMVFSGEVKMNAGALTTIYFNPPFEYDGSSNVALIVDDNTGTYSQGMNCRAFEDGDRALFVYSDNTDYDPYDPVSNSGTLSQKRNHMVLGIARYDYTVDVTANPEEGVVSVDEGPFYYGQNCTVTATPIGDNVFYYWAEDGIRISTDSVFTFAVNGNRHLTAYFGPPVSVTVVASPEEGGTVTGGGNFGIGQPCFVSATTNEGYLFTSWTLYDSVMCNLCDYDFHVAGETVLQANFEKTPDNSIVVGQATTARTLLPTYSYYNNSLTQQIYTAEEIGRAADITSIAFFNATYEKTRDLTVYLVHTDKSVFENNNDWIVPRAVNQVFSDTVTFTVGSWVDLFFDVPFSYDGTSNLAVIIDDNTGTWENNHLACRSYDVDDYQAMIVYNDNTNFDPLAPQDYNGSRLSYKNQIILGMEGYVQVPIGSLKSVSVYPNPAESELFIEGEDLVKMEVYNTLGQLVETVVPESVGMMKLDVEQYESAVYVLKIYSGESVTTKRFVKQKMM